MVIYSRNSDETLPSQNGGPSTPGYSKACGSVKPPVSNLILHSLYSMHVCACLSLSSHSMTTWSTCWKILEKVNTNNGWFLPAHQKVQSLHSHSLIFFQVLLFEFGMWCLYTQPQYVAVHFIFITNTRKPHFLAELVGQWVLSTLTRTQWEPQMLRTNSGVLFTPGCRL